MMFRPRIIPLLLLKNKGLVKTTCFNKSSARYIGDPFNAVRIFNDLEADELIFLDISASAENRVVDPDIAGKIGDEAFMPFAVGGGIKSAAEIKALLSAGVEKIVLSTFAVTDIKFVKEVSGQFGSQSIIVSIDYKRNILGKTRVYIKGGSVSTSFEPVELAIKMQSFGAGEILLHSIDRDGTMQGYDLKMIEAVANAVDIPVIACGGAGEVSHFREAIFHGASAIAAGSMFVYHGPRKAVLINYPDKTTLTALFTEKSN